MAEITMDDLRRIMRECGGETGADLDGDIAAKTFADLGYDSLAVLEMSSAIQREFEVVVPDGALAPEATTHGAVDLVRQLARQQ